MTFEKNGKKKNVTYLPVQTPDFMEGDEHDESRIAISEENGDERARIVRFWESRGWTLITR